jgi:hypothetical protein
MQQRLPLFWATKNISSSTIIFDLHYMPTHSEPPFYLLLVIIGPTTHKISAVPLKPPARVLRMYPAFCLPYRKRLTRVYAKVIQLFVPLPIG